MKRNRRFWREELSLRIHHTKLLAFAGNDGNLLLLYFRTIHK
jgi:hypothetical protein